MGGEHIADNFRPAIQDGVLTLGSSLSSIRGNEFSSLTSFSRVSGSLTDTDCHSKGGTDEYMYVKHDNNELDHDYETIDTAR